jgi:hypothetical protein
MKNYYLLVDLSFTPFKMNPDYMQNSSLSVFWLKVNHLDHRVKKLSFIILDDSGYIIKCVWPKKVNRVSSIIINVLDRISIEASDWDTKTLLDLKSIRANIKNNYGSREIFKKKMALLPFTQNSLYNIC